MVFFNIFSSYDLWVTCFVKWVRTSIFQKFMLFCRCIFTISNKQKCFKSFFFPPKCVIAISASTTILWWYIMLTIFWEVLLARFLGVLSFQGEKVTFTLIWQWPRVFFKVVARLSLSTTTFSYPAEGSLILHVYSTSTGIAPEFLWSRRQQGSSENLWKR